MVLPVVLEFENGSREEELFVVFVAWQFFNGRCCWLGAQGCAADLFEARLVGVCIIGFGSTSVFLAL